MRSTAWTLLVRAVETGAPDLVVVPAMTLASLRQEGWDVPPTIEELAGAVSLSQPEVFKQASLARCFAFAFNSRHTTSSREFAQRN